MKFGKSSEEAKQESRGTGGGQSFMKYMRDGDNVIQVVEEPDKWVWYWEHYNPGGNAFPCTNERESCPGCTSDDEKMAKASRKIAFNALSEYDGKQYLNVWKVPKSVADKLETRFDRLGTITDRPYMVTRFKKDNGFFDYDVEGLDKEKPEFNAEHIVDPETMLAQAYDEAWGDSNKVKNTTVKAKEAQTESSLKAKIKASKPEPKPEPPPSEVTEESLRSMSFFELVNFCKENGFGEAQGDTVDEVVDWMIAS